MLRRLCSVTGVASILAALALPVHAQNWPTRPIRILVGFAPAQAQVDAEEAAEDAAVDAAVAEMEAEEAAEDAAAAEVEAEAAVEDAAAAEVEAEAAVEDAIEGDLEAEAAADDAAAAAVKADEAAAAAGGAAATGGMMDKMKGAASVGVGTAADLADYYRLGTVTARPRLAELVGAGRLVPVAVEGWRDPAYLDPDARTLTREAPRRAASLAFEALGDGLLFLTPPLGAAMEITGPIAAKLFLASSTRDADVFLVLRVFAPDGSEVTFHGANDPRTPVAQGWLRASHRKLDPPRSLPYRPWHPHDELWPLTPGEVVELVPPTPLDRGRDHYVDLSDEALDALHEYVFSTPTSMKTYFAPPVPEPTD